MLHLDAIAADPFAAPPASDLSHPERLAEFLAPALAREGLRATPTGWTRDGSPLADAEVIEACLDLLGDLAAELPPPPVLALEESVRREQGTAAFWEARDHTDLADLHARRAERLADRVAAERSTTDPLDPLRVALLDARLRLEVAPIFTRYVVAEVASALA